MTEIATKTMPKAGSATTERRGAPQLRVIYSPSYRGRTIYSLLKGAETTIGRAEPDCAIAFPKDDGMSKLHAKFKVSESDGAVLLRDLSKNGTFAGPNHLRKNEVWHRIEDGDVLRFANTICMVRYEPVKPDDAHIPSLVGTSLAMKALRHRIARAAVEDRVSILLTGETGSGKELVARAIHDLSQRKAGPFIAINCAAVPETLAESEFFGNTKSAFTGAAPRKGCFRAADGGSLFLDEIGDMDPKLQPRLFRVLSEHEVTPLGSDIAVATDFRLIAATNQLLWHEGVHSNFRKELFARIAQLPIHVPPLRDRREDIISLLLHFYADAVDLLDGDFVHLLLKHDWPLNVRQLYNLSQQLRIERTTNNIMKQLEQLENRSADDEEEEEEEEEERPPRGTSDSRSAHPIRPPTAPSQPHVVPSKEQLINFMLTERGNVSRVALHLGCDRRSVRRYLALHRLSADDFRNPPPASASGPT
jgi:DNA-binding NtrC family response regulator